MLQSVSTPQGDFPSKAKPSTAPNPLRRVVSHAAAPGKRKPNPRNLTPQFHWNLNDVSQECLSDDERASLYHLFRFYDSSLEGDALPAIHFDRFVELLRDGELLASGDAFSEADDELQTQTIERAFAQAVLGKLRTYLDGEAEPALTFHVFCGALFNCAVVKYPEVTPPEAAYRKLVAQLLSAQSRGGVLTSTDSTKGFVQHSEHAAIPSWSVQDLHRHLPSDPRREPFLDREMFQDVLSGLCHDKLLDGRLKERLDSQYALPDEHLAYFHADTIAYVTDRFRTFDVFDKGVIPRDEVFALLSGMARKLEITDVYEVIAVILAGAFGDHKQLPRGSLVLTAPSGVTEVSLAQVMQALYVCRRSRSASYQSTQQSHSRKPGGVAAALAKSGAASETSAAEESIKLQSPEKKAAAAASSGKADKRKVKTSVSSQHHKAGPGPSPSKKSGGSSQTAKRSGVKKDKKTANHDVGVPRRPSKLSASSNDASVVFPNHDTDGDVRSVVHGEGIVRQDSFKSSSSTSSARTIRVPSIGGGSEASITSGRPAVGPRANGEQGNDCNPQREERDGESTQNANRSAQRDAPALTLRLFRRQNDAHTTSLDGAICVTLELFLVPRPSRIVESQGVHYASNGNRDEVWDTRTHSIDDQIPLEAALVFAKRLVAEKEHDKFVLVPEQEQRGAIAELIREIRHARCPRYAAALHSPRRRQLGQAKEEPPPDLPTHENGLRRGGLFVRSSLERGSTWARQKSSSDLLAILSDSMLQKKLKMKKRQSILASSNSGHWRPEPNDPSENNRSRTVEDRRTPQRGRQQEPNYGQLLSTWGLATSDDWITSLDDPGPLRLSQSVPALLPATRPTKLEPLGQSSGSW